MNQKVKTLISTAISLVPIHWCRVFLYKLLPGYKIGRSFKIGFMARISVERFECGDNVTIGRNTFFKGPMTAIIGSKVYIGRDNFFECGDVTTRPDKAYMKYAREIIIGNECLISEDHFFDVYGRINIGDGTWIAGRSSQFWTHGASAQDRDINIGSKCYVGSSVGFAPGSSIADRVVVGMGAIIPGKILENDVLIGGVPAKILRSRPSGGDGLIFERWDI